MFLHVFGPVGTFLEVFGHFRIFWDVLRCSGHLGMFHDILKCFRILGHFRTFGMFLDVFFNALRRFWTF